MTVKELIEVLKGEHPDRIIVMAADPDGKSHAPLADLYAGAYKEGMVGLDRLGKIAKAAGYTEKNILPGGAPAVILIPGKK